MDLYHFLEDVEYRRDVCAECFEGTHRALSSHHTPCDHLRMGFRRITRRRP